MYFRSKQIRRLLWSAAAVCLLLNAPVSSWAKNIDYRLAFNKTASAAATKTKSESPPQRPAEDTPAAPDKIDEVGEKVDEKVDNFTRKASSLIGAWIDTKVFRDITWLKLILCLLLLFVVLLIERAVRLTIDRRKMAIEDEKGLKPIRHLLLESSAKPLSLFIWVYGIYLVMTPLFLHFHRPDGTNLVYTVARKAADLGAAVALVWFIFKLVSIVDFKLKNWAASTDNAIDDVLAPLAGRTLRVFIVIIGGVLIIQNLTGVEI
ncbi:MAG: hypothetical protein PVG34_14345, partial [Desulfobacterales bacterium]